MPENMLISRLKCKLKIKGVVVVFVRFKQLCFSSSTQFIIFYEEVNYRDWYNSAGVVAYHCCQKRKHTIKIN